MSVAVPRCCLLLLVVPVFSFSLRPPSTCSALSLHAALPIFFGDGGLSPDEPGAESPDRFDYDPERPVPSAPGRSRIDPGTQDRKSTRLNSSHRCISYAVFSLKKKNH